jgi:hypothetical protein
VDLLRRLAEPVLGLLLRVGVKNLVKKLMHSISVIRRDLIEDVAPEVYTEGLLGMTALPDAS